VKSAAKANRIARLLAGHVERLRACRLCPQMQQPVVSGGPVLSKILLVGQAPSDKEPVLGRPFAWTAGKTLFGWFHDAAGMDETTFRSSIYMAAVCRCFPGKKPAGGDRVPSPAEISNCSSWLKREIEILQPELVLPVGKLAIEQFMPLSRSSHSFSPTGGEGRDEGVTETSGALRTRPKSKDKLIPQKLDAIIGKKFRVIYAGHEFDLIPLPHPSGASPWHRIEPGKSLLRRALKLIVSHPAFQKLPG
jgi:uracil-DNA glycosylase